MIIVLVLEPVCHILKDYENMFLLLVWEYCHNFHFTGSTFVNYKFGLAFQYSDLPQPLKAYFRGVF